MDDNSRHNRYACLREAPFRSRLVIRKEAGPCVGSHDERTAILEQKPDKWPKEPAAVKVIGMVDDKVAGFSKSGRLSLNLLGIGKDRLVAEGI